MKKVPRQGARASVPGPQGTTQGQPLAGGRITPELVRAVADKVYARLLADLEIERERCRFPGRGPGRDRGGR